MSTYSLCLVLLLNYNILSWLTIKIFFIMMGLLIPGLETVIDDHINIFMSPLLEELKEI